MRLGMVVVGVILLILGAVMLFVPLSPQPDQNVTTGTLTTSGSGVSVFSVSGWSLTGSIPVSISWSAPSAVVVGAVACSGSCNNPSTSGSGVAVQTGSSGSFTLNQPNGGEIGLVAITTTGSSAVTVTFKVTTALTTVGSILLILGILVLIVGIVLKSRAKASAGAPAAMPTAPAEPPMTPPAQ